VSNSSAQIGVVVNVYTLGTEMMGVCMACWANGSFSSAELQAKDMEIKITAVSKNLFCMMNYFASKIDRIKVIPYPNKF
jgi:hypothetical protein